MASDSFTNSNGTALSTHDANWSTVTGFTGSVTIQSNQARGPDFANSAYRYTASSSDDSQVVKKAQAALGNNRYGVSVRMGSASIGYSLRLRTLSGDNFTEAAIYKHTTFVGSGSISASRLSDITLRVQATTNGSDQDIRAWVNGSAVTFGYSEAGTTYSGTVLTDPSANTPITSGAPGFIANNGSAAQAETYFDDWDDLLGGDPEGSLIQGKLLRGGLLLGGVLTR